MPITRLPPDEAKAKLDEGFTYVDVRTEEEFEEGHPEGAVNVPVAGISASSAAPAARPRPTAAATSRSAAPLRRCSGAGSGAARGFTSDGAT